MVKLMRELGGFFESRGKLLSVRPASQDRKNDQILCRPIRIAMFLQIVKNGVIVKDPVDGVSQQIALRRICRRPFRT